jgi:hypothetical protein
MPDWRDLTVGELAEVAGVIRAFHAERGEPNLPAQVLELGARVYTARCAQCHGEGRRDGWAVRERVVPTNFVAGVQVWESLRALRNGIEELRWPRGPASSVRRNCGCRILCSRVYQRTVWRVMDAIVLTAIVCAAVFDRPGAA